MDEHRSGPGAGREPEPSGAALSVVAAAIAEPSRARMLSALMSGVPWTIGELAAVAGVRPNTASDHARRLRDAGLVTLSQHGRHVQASLAGPDVARALEALALISPELQPAATLAAHRDAEALANGRTCYRHLGGRVAVHLAEHFVQHGLITDAFDVTPDGEEWFATRGITTPVAAGKPLTPCLDWTERRPHLAGPLAERLTEVAFRERWIERLPRSRAIRLTDEGATALLDRA